MIFHEIKEAVAASEVLSNFLGPPQAHRFLCPFHPDKNPSMTAKDGGIICWSCGWSGDIFKFVQEHQGVSIGDALRICADLAGIVLPDRTPVDRDDRLLRLPSLAQSHAQVVRETAAIKRDIFYQVKKAAGLAWRIAWDAKETDWASPNLQPLQVSLNVWDAVEIGAALDREIEFIEMASLCEEAT